jgi:uncharacterized radical SAM superfamily Fe-S cluster-containing enzyme
MLTKFPPAPPINVNPLNRVAVAAATASLLPECAARMPAEAQDKAGALVLRAAEELASLGWRNRNPYIRRP